MNDHFKSIPPKPCFSSSIVGGTCIKKTTEWMLDKILKDKTASRKKYSTSKSVGLQVQVELNIMAKLTMEVIDPKLN